MSTYSQHHPAMRVARNIVNQILDEAGTDAVRRQAINDRCDQFTARLLMEFKASGPFPQSFQTYPDGSYSGEPPTCARCGGQITSGTLKILHDLSYHGDCVEGFHR